MSFHIPIPTSELPLEKIYDFDLMVLRQKQYVLFREQNLAMTQEVADRLRESGVEHLYIHEQDYANFVHLSQAGQSQKAGLNKFSQYLFDHFIPINKGPLVAGSCPEFIIFQLQGVRPIPVVGPNQPELSAAIEPKHCDKKSRLYIRREDMPAFQQYLKEQLGQKASYTPLNEAGGTLIRENLKLAMHGIYQQQTAEQARTMAKQAVDELMPVLVDNPDRYYSMLMSGETEDFHMLSHSVNVSILAMGLGMMRKLSPQEVQQLGVAGLLHDIGKRFISMDQSTTQVSSDPAWYESSPSHVKEGIQFCALSTELEDQVIRIIHEHHELLDGTGFPNQLQGDDIHPLSQILGLIEHFDQFTTGGPERDAMTPYRALAKLRKMGKAMNQDLVTDFVRSLGEQQAG
ncbi:HD-GYP domain-containing protein [Magnetococcus sp. PR-3]|uniref:HD-GYP domain-containing protein n=1 Tax=Magnetococcus sp. PR-3 TaxID=3120355 RepID=UPI002FCE2515